MQLFIKTRKVNKDLESLETNLLKRGVAGAALGMVYGGWIIGVD